MYRKHKTIKAIYYIINHLRKEDKEEMIAKYGRRKWKKQIIKQSKKIDFDILFDNKTKKPFIMGGINISNKKYPDVGAVWMLTTNGIYKHKFKVIKVFLKELKKYDNKYFLIFNFIYKKNFFMKEFALKLGFKTTSAQRFGYKNDWELIYKTKKMKGLS